MPIPLVLPRRFIRQCRRSRSRVKVTDSSGLELTGGRLLTASLMLRRVLLRGVLAADEQNVGVLLPPSVGGVLANSTLALMRRVAVNLNYTLTNEAINDCIRHAGIRHVLTSRRVLAKCEFELDAEPIFLEDLKARATRRDKLAAAFQALALPTTVLERYLGLTAIRPDDLLTIVFTSGSTGEPKGVMLTHANVGSNTQAVDEAVHIRAEDVLLGILPFFHSFGYTATLWLALTHDPKAVYHFNPLDAREVGRLCEEHGVTILMAAPTFLRSYLKRCTPQQMHALNLVVVGAEKLPHDLAEEFCKKFGLEPSEGYGTTELSPVVSVNVPKNRLDPGSPLGTKFGTVGHPLPGIRVKVVDPDSGAELPTETEGLLLVSGPNVMAGYYNEPEKTAAVMREGWYVTGDFARVDRDGFVTITGRQSRFSKIGGEMVPHLRIEELLLALVSGQGGDEYNDGLPDLQLAVTAVPDPKKGERLIVLHKPLSTRVDDLVAGLHAGNLPNLWIPDRESFVEVDAIPMLGSGKLDLKAVQQLALERTGPMGRASNPSARLA